MKDKKNKIIIADKFKFSVFITFSIGISFVLVVVGMALYSSSGAAQLDLSRPGYVGVRSQADTKINNYKDFPSVGVIDISVINEFKDILSAQSDNILAADAFSGDPLSPEALGFGSVF